MTTPDLLFHTVLRVIDYHTDTSGATQTVYVLGTHTTLESAKAFSLKALQGLGYEESDFAEYKTRANLPTGEEWPYGDGILVHAVAPAGQAFEVRLDTKNNTESLPEGEDHTLKLPAGHDHLHYVLQTKTDYNQDRSGAYQITEIEGCYVSRGAAHEAALAALSGIDRDNFSQYDQRDDADEQGRWPYGEDVVVHAVAETGENYLVCVRTVPGAHKKYSKTR